MSLSFVGAQLQYRYNLGSGEATLTSNASLELNYWHTVTVTRTGRQGMLSVDSQPQVTGESPGPLTGLQLGGRLWLGGYSMFMNISSLTGASAGFSGCISSLFLGSRQLDLVMEAEQGLGVGQCNVSMCDGNPCLNGGSCMETNTNFVCVCPASYTGPLCAAEADPCASIVCTNGGTCRNAANGVNFTCLCPLGRGGELCEEGKQTQYPKNDTANFCVSTPQLYQ